MRRVPYRILPAAVWVATLLIATSLPASTPWTDVRLDRIAEASVGDALPPGWEVRPVRGEEAPATRVVRDETHGQALRFEGRGQAAFFGNELAEPIDVAEGRLRWSWRVDQALPDARLQVEELDDSPARLMVVFGRRGVFSRPRIIFYTWGNEEARGTSFSSRASSRMHIIVLRNGEDPTGEWVTEERDLRADYRASFGREPEPVGGIGFMSDTEDVPGAHGISLLGPVHWAPGGR